MPAENLMPLPRGKWAAYHKLAYAIHGRRSSAVIHAGQMGKFLMDAMVWRRRTMNSWFGALAAEAYAANGAFVLYQVEAPFGMASGLQRFWGGTGEVNRFVRQHPDLYDGPLASGSTTALLVLLREKGRTIRAVFPSSLGFAAALGEGRFFKSYDSVHRDAIHQLARTGSGDKARLQVSSTIWIRDRRL